MFYRIKRVFRIIKWLWRGCEMLRYEGFMCGACGKGWKETFYVPTFYSLGEWWDTVGLCPKGKGCHIEVEKWLLEIKNKNLKKAKRDKEE